MKDYARIEQAIRYLDHHRLDQPDLRAVASAVGLSEFHFHRLFRRWTGVTPKDFLQALTAAHAKSLLHLSRSVMDTALESGLSGPSRLHDLFVTLEGVTPGEYKERGRGLEILYGWHPTPFGPCLIGLTDRGICHLSFLNRADHPFKSSSLQALKRQWPHAMFKHHPAVTKQTVSRLFRRKLFGSKNKISVLAMGTPFQLKVWEAILKIPAGKVLSYQQVARLAGKPKAARAVGSALAKNSIGYLIPCHRVIHQTGIVGNYRWGRFRKRAMLAWESAKPD